MAFPVADPATGLWQSATMPQNLVMQDVQVTYGPGTAEDRWYTDVGVNPDRIGVVLFGPKRVHRIDRGRAPGRKYGSRHGDD